MKLHRYTSFTLSIALLSGTAAVALAAPDKGSSEKKDDQPNPYAMSDGSWIGISGRAIDPHSDVFTLDYGEGVVTVEVDDWDWYNENAPILEGDKVTVYGAIDDDTYELTSIEASSVYVENLGTYFYASPVDEETTSFNGYAYFMSYDPIEIGKTNIIGTVTHVDGREFTLNNGLRKLTVDTSDMPYNPMDDIGYQEVDINDRVYISGEMDYNFWSENELVADTVVTLDDQRLSRPSKKR